MNLRPYQQESVDAQMSRDNLIADLHTLRNAYLSMSEESRENLKGDALKKTLDSLIGSSRYGAIRFRAAGVAYIPGSAIRQIPKSETAKRLLGEGEDPDLRRNARLYGRELHLEHQVEHSTLHALFWAGRIEELLSAYALAIITYEEKKLLDSTKLKGQSRYVQAGVTVQ